MLIHTQKIGKRNISCLPDPEVLNAFHNDPTPNHFQNQKTFSRRTVNRKTVNRKTALL